MKLTKLLTGILAGAAISAFADASTAIPRKVGPVSYYGALHTSGNKIIGAKNNQQAMLRGVSLFWSDATGASYYNPNVISWVVDNFKIDVFRFAMGIEYYDSNGGTKNAVDGGYKTNPEGQLSMIDKMVQTAIENDVYIIIDWHSHRAHQETTIAKDFFQKVSLKYKDVPNVIYEIYNEPVSGSGGNWDAIKNYASSVRRTGLSIRNRAHRARSHRLTSPTFCTSTLLATPRAATVATLQALSMPATQCSSLNGVPQTLTAMVNRTQALRTNGLSSWTRTTSRTATGVCVSRRVT